MKSDGTSLVRAEPGLRTLTPPGPRGAGASAQETLESRAPGVSSANQHEPRTCEGRSLARGSAAATAKGNRYSLGGRASDPLPYQPTKARIQTLGIRVPQRGPPGQRSDSHSPVSHQHSCALLKQGLGPPSCSGAWAQLHSCCPQRQMKLRDVTFFAQSHRGSLYSNQVNSYGS